MPDIWKKLNLKDQSQVVVVNAPQSFEDAIDQLESALVVRSCGKAKQIEFILAFVSRRAEIKRITQQIVKKSVGDAVVWFAYPKQTSRNYACEFNRDSGWEPVTSAGFKDVRMVAIDEDWSALRFRRKEFVKST